jgi:hypothetical protein
VSGPTKRHTWNLGPFGQALGLTREDTFDVETSVQPVVLVGDFHYFAAQLQTPRARYGSQIAAGAAGQLGGAQIHTRSPGGAVVHIRWQSILIAPNRAQLAVFLHDDLAAATAVVGAIAGPTVLAGHNYGNPGAGPVVNTSVTKGYFALATIGPLWSTDAPAGMWYLGQNEQAIDWWIAPGQVITVVSGTSNQDQFFAIDLHEHPAALFNR